MNPMTVDPASDGEVEEIARAIYESTEPWIAPKFWDGWKLTDFAKADERTRAIHHAMARAVAPRLTAATEAKDGAYAERNQCVGLIAKFALASGFKVGIAQTAIEGWSEDWHGCVYIDLPTGQVSWHYHDSDAELFALLPAYDGAWDGHSTPEKYERVNASRPTLSEEKARAATERAVKAEALARELSDTLLKLRPLGGSELFIRRGGEHYADPKWFADVIEEDRQTRHEACKAAVRAQRSVKAAESTIASLQSQVEAMRVALEFSGRVMRGRPERSVADNLALAKTDAALAALGQKEADHG